MVINGRTVTDIIVLAIIILVIDGLFLYNAKGYFSRQVMLVQGTALQVNMTSALLCYFIIIIGLYYFVLRHLIIPNASSLSASIQTMNLKDGMITAFFLGLLVYGVYETTTMAIFRNWSPLTVLIDTTWGGVLFALSTYVYYRYKSLDI